MIGFFTGLGIIIAMSVVALIISSKRDDTTIDNFALEYKKMFDEGLVPRRRHHLY